MTSKSLLQSSLKFFQKKKKKKAIIFSFNKEKVTFFPPKNGSWKWTYWLKWSLKISAWHRFPSFRESFSRDLPPVNVYADSSSLPKLQAGKKEELWVANSETLITTLPTLRNKRIYLMWVIIMNTSLDVKSLYHFLMYNRQKFTISVLNVRYFLTHFTSKIILKVVWWLVDCDGLILCSFYMMLHGRQAATCFDRLWKICN